MAEHLLDLCLKHEFAFELQPGDVSILSVLVDGSHFVVDSRWDGFDGLVESILLSDNEKASFDIWKILHLNIPLTDLVTDVRLLHGGATNLKKLAVDGGQAEHAIQIEKWDELMNAHIRAGKAAGVDVVPTSFLLDGVPPPALRGFLRSRAMAIYDLAFGPDSRRLDPTVVDRIHRSQMTLFEIEQAGIPVDVELAREFLRTDDPSQASRRTLMSIADAEDGFVYSAMDPIGVKTGRFRVRSGFNCLGIPHGPARQCIRSRVAGGEIWVADFNAIDYRCIIASIDDPVIRKKYEDCEDFHSRTASFLLGEQVSDLQRDVIKAATYIYIYGGSNETLAERTGLSLPRVKKLVELLDRHMKPVEIFRDTLKVQSDTNGQITLPHGSVIETSKSDHAGKILGLYAQGYSSMVFDTALGACVRAMRASQSFVIFSVHDEIVIDVHPSDHERVERILDEVRESVGQNHFLKVKKGKNYADASQ